ncbi:MAG: hypothetical protein KC621_26855 [Myxococcales bacterium]|nr:hypothetical protein [Myxococcales bacterium]
MRTVFLVAAFVACKKEEPTPDRLTDTGWFETVGTTTVDCYDRFVTTVPTDGTHGWYWRDRPVVYAQTENHASYQVWLQDTDGNRLDTSVTWDGLAGTVEWDGWLSADTTYELVLEDCATTSTVTFDTSELGAPLSVSASSLVGNTYLLDLVDANWVEPATLAPLVYIYFTTPVLLGVQYADSTRIDLVGAPGVVDQFGVVTQDASAPTWDFPLSDFTDSPFLDARVDSLVLQYTDGGVTVDIPVENYVFQATFEPDGRTLGGGVLSGRGDTRYLGALLGDDSPGTMCELADSLQVPCQPCADGLPYCLDIRAEDIHGTLVDGLRLVERG